MENDLLPVIFVVSDGRGETCNQWLRAALVQFESEDFDLVTWSEVRTPGQVKEIVGRPGEFAWLPGGASRSLSNAGSSALELVEVELK